MERYVLPVKKQGRNPVNQFIKVPGSFDADDLHEWRRNLGRSGCYPIDKRNFDITACFTDSSGEEQIQIRNAANGHLDCVPVAIAYRIFDMSTVWGKYLFYESCEEVHSAILNQMKSRGKNECDQCGKTFVSKQGLSLHITRAHTKKRSRIEEAEPKRMRRHNGYSEYRKIRKQHGEKKLWSDLSADEKKPYESSAVEKNIQDGFDSVKK